MDVSRNKILLIIAQLVAVALFFLLVNVLNLDQSGGVVLFLFILLVKLNYENFSMTLFSVITGGVYFVLLLFVLMSPFSIPSKIIILMVSCLGGVGVYIYSEKFEQENRLKKGEAQSVFEQNNILNDKLKRIGVEHKKTTATAEAISEKLDDIKKILETFGEKAGELFFSSLPLSGDIEVANDKLKVFVHSVNATILEIGILSEQIQNNTKGQEDLAISIESANKNLQTAFEINKIMYEEMQKSKQTIKETIESITLLGEYQEQTLAVLGVIKQIASRTNMLAMNAAIEAAHAGQFGSGFSVVASEVRILADESSKKAKSISTIIKNMNQQIETSVTNINTTYEILNNMTEEIEKSYQCISALSGEMEELKKSDDEFLLTSQNLKNSAELIEHNTEKAKTISSDYQSTFSTLGTYFGNLMKVIDFLNDYAAKTGNSLDAIYNLHKEDKISLANIENTILEGESNENRDGF